MHARFQIDLQRRSLPDALLNLAQQPAGILLRLPALWPPEGTGLAERAAKGLRPVQAGVERGKPAETLPGDYGGVRRIMERRPAAQLRQQFFLHRQPEVGVAGQFTAA